MIIGVDFDNTIVCYDGLFHRAAVERGAIPAHVGVSKEEVRDFLRGEGREDLWTELQAYIYGQYILDASPYPEMLRFFRLCLEAKQALYIISHKTRRPYRGPDFDLHDAALQWLHSQGIFAVEGGGLLRKHVFFEETKAAKLKRIATMECDVFLDDLPEFLDDPDFPNRTRKVLFDPRGRRSSTASTDRVGSWAEFAAMVREGMDR